METPVLLRADIAKNNYRGFALSQLRILKREMALGGLEVSARTVRLDNGVVIICSKVYKQEFVDIIVPPEVIQNEEFRKLAGDFLMHPKFGRIVHTEISDIEYNTFKIPTINSGGITLLKKQWQELTDVLAYTLIDGDGGTFSLTIKNVKIRFATNECYGNSWWQGETDKIPLLSWKGAPSVQFPIKYNYEIPGFSQKVPQSSGYTVFERYIYQGGTVLCRCPIISEDNDLANLVVGACYTTDISGTRWLICLTNAFKGNAYKLQVWKTKDLGKTWYLLDEFNSTFPKVSAFIHEDGKQFVYENTKYRINYFVTQVITEDTVQIEKHGTRNIVGTGGYGSDYAYAGEGTCWANMGVADKLSFSKYTVNASFTSFGRGDQLPVSKKVPVYRGNAATSILVKLVPNSVGVCDAQSGYGAKFEAVVNGTYCSVEWYGVDCASGLEATKFIPTCSSGYTVTATLRPQGISASFTVPENIPANITITGTQDCGVNTPYGYSATNAIGTVTWSNSKGTIDANGNAVFTGCGSAVISCTDQCGRTGTLSIKLPSGNWHITQRYVDSVYHYGCDFSYWEEITFNEGIRTTRAYANATQYIYSALRCVDDSSICNQYTDASATQPAREWTRWYTNGTVQLPTYYQPNIDCPTKCSDLTQVTLTLTWYKGVCAEYIAEFLCPTAHLVDTVIDGMYTHYIYEDG